MIGRVIWERRLRFSETVTRGGGGAMVSGQAGAGRERAASEGAEGLRRSWKGLGASGRDLVGDWEAEEIGSGLGVAGYGDPLRGLLRGLARHGMARHRHDMA